MKELLFLYSELMPYTLSVFRSLVEVFNCNITVVHWDKKKKTPFTAENNKIAFYKRSELDSFQIKKIINDIDPDLIYVSGRMDKGYLKVAKYAKGKSIPVVMGSDTQWKGDLRDRLKVLFQRFLYKPYFSHAWVCGKYQYELVRRIGFPKNKIINNLYSADVNNFLSVDQMKSAGNSRNRDVLFIGRLDKIKGVENLVTVLSELKNNGAFDGNLWLYGNGPLESEIPDVEWIKKMGFSSQKEILEGVKKCSFFCLPSIGEPWGVVIHEMAVAGMPIICTDVCGAATEFVIDGYNGFIFKANSKNGLKNCISKMLQLKSDEINEFGKRSRHLGQRITPDISAASLLSVLS